MRKDFVCQEDINHKKYDVCFRSSGEGCIESARLSGETPGKMVNSGDSILKFCS
jgi:hypothetical protein